MEGPDEKSSLENLKEKLYAPKKMDIERSSPVHHAPVPAPIAWESEPVPVVVPPAPKMSWAVKFLLSALGFFVIAGAISAILLFGGLRAISTDRVAVEITSSKANLASGDTVELFVTVTNKNPATITNTNLVIDLPPGTRSPTNIEEPFDHYVDNTLGDIPSGGQVTRSFKVVMFGAQNQALTIPSRLEYRTAGSNALAVKKADYSVTITTSPILVTVTPVGEIASGQLFTLSVSVRSNATTPLSGIALASQYPSGFVETTTNPKTSGGFFQLGTLSPGEDKKVTITGTLTGQSLDERTFTFTAGTAKEDGTNALSLPYSTATADVTIAKPFLGVSLTFNHDATEPAIVPAELPVSALLTWQNTLTVPVQNAQIAVTLSGAPLDTTSIRTQNGFYRSSDSTIIFSKDTNPSLALLQPGDTGSATFSFSPKVASALSGLRNPTITLLMSVNGRRVGENGGVGVVTSTITRKVQIASSFTLSSTLTRSGGPFANTGPLPPKANVESTYTVLLSAQNSLNSIGGAKLTTTLPDYVRFTGKTSTKNGTITYDASSRVVTWNIGDISSNAGVDGAFQIALLPSSSQEGTSPRLIGTQNLTGSDTFTKKSVSVNSDPLTTASVGGRTEDGIVTK